MRIIISTNNNHKVNEFKNIISDSKYEIYSLNDLNIHINSIEDGNSFKENAFIKTNDLKKYMSEHNLLLDSDILISDDSGLCIDKLDGNPGINSSRFMGEDTDYIIKNNAILDMLSKYSDINDRSAHYMCVICAYINNNYYYFEGKMEGYIGFNIKGTGGFGYDPIFYLKQYDKCVAELESNIKYTISHRYKAINNLLNFLQNL